MKYNASGFQKKKSEKKFIFDTFSIKAMTTLSNKKIRKFSGNIRNDYSSEHLWKKRTV